MDTARADAFAIALSRWFEDLSDRGIFTTDTDLVVRTWNPWLQAQTGVPEAAAVGRHLFELYPSLSERGLGHHYQDALAGEVRVLSERFHKYLLPISRSFPPIGLTEMSQSARIAPLTVNETVIGTISVIEDVTERVVSERELRNQIAASERARSVAEEASKLKDEFLATLSHEIRTPLNAVLGWARILRTQPNIKSRDRALEVIERNAASQLRLVEDLLDMARVISGKLRLEIKPVALADVTRAAIDVVEPGAAAKKITIRATFPDEIPLVSGDADRLQQAIWNLMSNAVKFTEPGGQIDVTLAVAGDMLVLTVHDDGQGISRDFLPFVFDRFRQADATPSRRHGGLGLGLALVRQLIELHGGKVSAESAGPNKGATFSITLPALEGVAARPRETGLSEKITLDGTTVLLVDDDDDSREMLAVFLRTYGAEVTSASSSMKALGLLEKGPLPDLVISDVGMPGTDGYEFIRRVRDSSSPRVRSLPAIAVTAYANPEDRIRALAAGFQAHVAKPIDPAIVASWISTLVTARQPPPDQTAS